MGPVGYGMLGMYWIGSFTHEAAVTRPKLLAKDTDVDDVRSFEAMGTRRVSYGGRLDEDGPGSRC